MGYSGYRSQYPLLLVIGDYTDETQTPRSRVTAGVAR